MASITLIDEFGLADLQKLSIEAHDAKESDEKFEKILEILDYMIQIFESVTEYQD